MKHPRRQDDKVMDLEDQTLREAFQVHPRAVSTQGRTRLLAELAGAGLRRLQLGSLVRPDRMPQMAGTERLLEAAAAFPRVEAWVLVFNRRGLERAVEAGFRHVALSASLSKVHSRRNLACSVGEGLTRCRELAEDALGLGLTVRMGLQCAFGGPMRVPPGPGELADRFGPFHGLGVRRLALCDTAGRAGPGALARVLRRLRQDMPGSELGLHLHGEAERLAANLEAAWGAGADWLDVTLQGRGGCPFLPGRPPGNLPLARATGFLRQKGHDPGLDLGRLERAAGLLEGLLTGRGAEDAPRSRKLPN